MHLNPTSTTTGEPQKVGRKIIKGWALARGTRFVKVMV
jgi:hypothetical protein